MVKWSAFHILVEFDIIIWWIWVRCQREAHIVWLV